MIYRLSRREFLQQSIAGLAAVGLPQIRQPIHLHENVRLGRVTASSVYVRRQPSTEAEVIYRVGRDELVQLYEQIEVDGYRNPFWYHVWGGYVHSGYIQPVEFNYQPMIDAIPATGCLFEVSVPYTRSYRLEQGQWAPNYRLYYSSTHWVKALETGPDGQPWYQIIDSYGRKYYARTAHLRRVQAAELEPISPDIPRGQKWIEVSIDSQELTAIEDGQIVLKAKISSGLPHQRELDPGELPTETPVGDHHIQVKTVSRHMGDEHFTADLDSGAYPGVPWVCFFDKDGYSLHGTYWHNNFGNRMSHGCVNMRCEDAKWIYRWALPAANAEDWQVSGWGIRVSIHS